MKNKVLEAFDELGFKLEAMDDWGYSFNYEGTNYLYVPNAEDEDFLSITIPGIYDINENNSCIAHELMDKLNSTLKYVKSYKLGNSIWLFYERELFGGEDLPAIISRMILHLEAALFLVRETIASSSKGNNTTEEETDNDNSTETED